MIISYSFIETSNSNNESNTTVAVSYAIRSVPPLMIPIGMSINIRTLSSKF